MSEQPHNINTADTEVEEIPSVAKLKERYKRAYFDSTWSTSLPVSVEEQERREQRRVVGQANLEPLFTQMVDTAANELIMTPPDGRLSYLEGLRTVFQGDPNEQQNLSDPEVRSFSDRLTVRVVEKLTVPPVK